MPDSNIPLEAVLKLAVEQSGSDQVKGFLESYTVKLKEGEDSVSRTNSTLREMADHVGRLGDSFRSMGGLLGLAGAGAVAQQFMAVSGAGADVAMAQGHLTGNAGTYGSYANALLGVQASTGVGYTQLEEGLRTAAQMAGGSLSPQGAARFGALIAGASLAGGLSPQAISSVLGSFMESTDATAGYGTPQGVSDITGMMAGVTQALSSFQGTQVGAMLPTVAALYEAQALRSGPAGPHEAPAQTAGFVNALAQANPMFRNAKTAEAAIEGANSYLASGLTNPKVRFTEAAAGISTSEAIEGGPEAIEKLMGQMRQWLGPEEYRTWLRTTFPAATAKMGEELANQPGVFREAHRKALEAVINPNIRGYEYNLHHSLGAQTPEAELSKFGAQLLGAGMSVIGPVNQAIGPIPTMLGILAGGSMVGAAGKAALGAASAAGKGILGGALAGADDATVALDLAAMSRMALVVDPLTAVAMGVFGPELPGTGGPLGSSHTVAKNASEVARYLTVEEAMRQAKQKYGSSWLSHQGAMEAYVRQFGSLKPGAEGPELAGHSDPQAMRILHEALGVARVPNVVKKLEGKFGDEWYKERHGHAQAEVEGFVGKRLSGAGRQTLDEEIGQLRKYQELGPEGYWQMKFGESVSKFDQAVEKYMHGAASGRHAHESAYEGGASQRNASYNPVSAAVATAPGAVLAAWMKPTTPAPTALPSALPNPSGPHNENIDYLSGVESGVGHWQKLINEASAAHPGASPALIAAVMTQESGGNPNAISGAGAEGLMQLMPSTALGLGVKNPLNARENTMGGARLIAELLNQYHGNLHMALEAYNAGPHNLAAGNAYANSVEAILRKIDQGIKQMNRQNKRVKGSLS